MLAARCSELRVRLTRALGSRPRRSDSDCGSDAHARRLLRPPRQRDAGCAALDLRDLHSALESPGRKRAEAAFQYRLEVVLGTPAGEVGLISALCPRVGKPASAAWPADAPASVSLTHGWSSTSSSPSRSWPSSPQERISSIVEVLIAFARGMRVGRGLRSRTSVSIPSRARAIAAVSPAGPAPTTTTGTSSICSSMRVPFIRRFVV